MPNVRTAADLSSAIAKNLWKIDRNSYDVVVGIPRSGMLPATMISTYLQLPLASLDGFIAGIVSGRSGRAAQPGRRILLVDDSCNKGGAMTRAMQLLSTMKPKPKVTRLAIYAPYQIEHPDRFVDITFEELRGPRVFAWNMWKHKRMARWAFDMDGVLCRDPERHENDDGEAYRAWMRRTEPLFVPLRPIGHIITSRLEKYRVETEEFLHRHSIQYASLTMLDLPDKRARMTAMKVDGGRGGWKARQFLKLREHAPELEMFIESCPKQSRIIARTAGIPVFCTQTQSVFEPERED